MGQSISILGTRSYIIVIADSIQIMGQKTIKNVFFRTTNTKATPKISAHCNFLRRYAMGGVNTHNTCSSPLRLKYFCCLHWNRYGSWLSSFLTIFKFDLEENVSKIPKYVEGYAPKCTVVLPGIFYWVCKVVCKLALSNQINKSFRRDWRILLAGLWKLQIA